MSPERIGPYKVVRKLGEGGMGAVFEAVQEPIGRRVAVKILHAKYAQDPQITARFFNEARAVNLIDHPGIVQVSDYGQLPDGTAYLVMEFLKGETLSQRVKKGGGLQLFEILRLARQIGSALAAAHDKNVYHRDLKPDNVMLVPDVDSETPGRERAKLLDFGIAKVAQPEDQSETGTGPSQAPRTSTDVVMGTPRYMAPEQCRGGVQIDDKADVYSLGIMLYELLGGRAPFIGASGEVLAMHIYEQPAPLQKLAPQLPEDLVALVHRLIQKKKEDRPSMRQVTQELEQLGVRHPTQMLSAIKLNRLTGLSGQQGAITPPGSSPTLTPPGTPSGLLGVLSSSQPSAPGLPSSPQVGGKTRVLVGAGIGTIALATGISLFFVLRGAPKPPPVPVAPPDAAPAIAEPAARKLVHWAITTVPPGAQVIRVADGVVLGSTPLTLDQPLGEGSTELRLKLPGFAERVIHVDRAADNTNHQVLDKLVAAPARPPVRPGTPGGVGIRKNPPVRPGTGPATGKTPATKPNDDQPRIVD